MTPSCQGPAVGLDEVLANKEARVKRQGVWLKRHAQALVSFSVNIPGPHKLSESASKVFEIGTRAIITACAQQHRKIIAKQVLIENTGPEGIFVIEGVSGLELKAMMLDIEINHSLGRLMDLDVIDCDGKSISRQGQQIPPRKCLICDEDAVVCARSRRHHLSELLTQIDTMVNQDECCS